MADPTTESVREAFENPDPGSDRDDYEVREVERNRSQYRVVIDEGSVSSADAERILEAAFGSDAVFGVGVTDDRVGDDGDPVRVVSFRAR